MVQKRVVLVETEVAFAKTLSRAMATAGYGCECVADSDGLSAAIDRNMPDLIVIDGTPDGPDPRALCQSLRRDMRNDRVKIVVLNGSGRSIEHRRSRAFGADGVIAKPFGLRELRAEMDRLLSETAAGAV